MKLGCENGATFMHDALKDNQERVKLLEYMVGNRIMASIEKPGTNNWQLQKISLAVISFKGDFNIYSDYNHKCVFSCLEKTTYFYVMSKK